MDEAKREFVNAWLTRASHDLAAAVKLSGGEDRYLDIAIYHCQQAAEKAVKGFLVFHDQRFKKVHDIELLVEMARPFSQEFEAWRAEGKLLTPYSRAFRYLDDFPNTALEPDQETFDEALDAATRLYTFVLSKLPDEVHP